MIKHNNLLNMSNEEAVEWFKEIIDTKLDPKFEQRLKEYHHNIERDFQEEWGKQRLKWLFTQRRQNKLKHKVYLRYTSPVFWIIEEVIEQTLPKAWSSDEYFHQFVDVKDIEQGE